MSSTGFSSYWCYRCSGFFRVWERYTTINCPNCGGGFVEEVENPSQFVHMEDPLSITFPVAGMYMLGNHPNLDSNAGLGFHQSNRRSASNQSLFNPIIVLRGPNTGGGGAQGVANGGGERGIFGLYYDDGTSSGLQPIPASMSNFLMGSGFDRLLDRLSQIETNGVGRLDNRPASKATIESLPTVEIDYDQIKGESHCVVCLDAFEIGTKAMEMPCKHIYHSYCIIPWLSIRNSCPICRHELPANGHGRSSSNPSGGHNNQSIVGVEDDTLGLTIWRLPSGGFAVGRFLGGRRVGERGFPVVYTEMDGGFNNGSVPRRISWTSRRSRSIDSGGIGRLFHDFFSFLGRLRFSPSRSNSESGNRNRALLNSIFNRNSRRRNRA